MLNHCHDKELANVDLMMVGQCVDKIGEGKTPKVLGLERIYFVVCDAG